MVTNGFHSDGHFTLRDTGYWTQTRTYWFSKRPNAIQKSHELMKDPQASTSTCQHNYYGAQGDALEGRAVCHDQRNKVSIARATEQLCQMELRIVITCQIWYFLP